MKKLMIGLLLLVAGQTMADTQNPSAMGTMDHRKMNHQTMVDQTMDHQSMDHSAMPMMSAVGMPAPGAKPDKVVHVILGDDMTIRFKKEVKIAPNDVVQFVIVNKGKMDHEFSIGSPEEQQKHREMMKTMNSHHHDSGNAVTVAPGKAKQLLWHFHGSHTVELACNIPGHYEAGMHKLLNLE